MIIISVFRSVVQNVYKRQPKGYGEQQPKTVTNFTLKSAPFLKVGDVLTEEFIKNLPLEQQEICNAINRRTEFKVLRTTYQ